MGADGSIGPGASLVFGSRSDRLIPANQASKGFLPDKSAIAGPSAIENREARGSHMWAHAMRPYSRFEPGVLAYRSRSMSRLVSRSAMAARLSWVLRPLATPISSFARPLVK